MEPRCGECPISLTQHCDAGWMSSRSVATCQSPTTSRCPTQPGRSADSLTTRGVISLPRDLPDHEHSLMGDSSIQRAMATQNLSTHGSCLSPDLSTSGLNLVPNLSSLTEDLPSDGSSRPAFHQELLQPTWSMNLEVQDKLLFLPYESAHLDMKHKPAHREQKHKSPHQDRKSRKEKSTNRQLNFLSTLSTLELPGMYHCPVCPRCTIAQHVPLPSMYQPCHSVIYVANLLYCQVCINCVILSCML